ncbi:MAG: PilW family protein [Gammaproteobacteria bacterium]|nr:PilW family protein [Gammaproteobacteria bacterium]
MTAKKYQSGVTLVELMVALAVGSFLMIGAVQVYNQSRQAFVINESIARVQETAQFAMDTVEADLRMASNWGMHSRGNAVEGRSLVGTPNPLALGSVPAGCGADWALDLGKPVEGDNNAYVLPCAATGGAQANSDTVTVRRATVAVAPLEAGRLQIQSTRIAAEVFDNGNVPPAFLPASSQTHNLMVNSYYVSANSTLIPGVPTLRRMSLGAGGAITDQEVAPGVENMQLQLGVDTNQDNTVDRYVNPGDPIFDPLDVAFIPGARVMTARVWMVVRSLTREVGIDDQTVYAPGDVNLGTPNDDFRRMQISKTILLRNSRT